MEVRATDGTLIVLDCGTGAHGLGLALEGSAEHPLRGHLMITHTPERPRLPMPRLTAAGQANCGRT